MQFLEFSKELGWFVIGSALHTDRCVRACVRVCVSLCLCLCLCYVVGSALHTDRCVRVRALASARKRPSVERAQSN